jgi:hypothetical protein
MDFVLLIDNQVIDSKTNTKIPDKSSPRCLSSDDCGRPDD